MCDRRVPETPFDDPDLSPQQAFDYWLDDVAWRHRQRQIARWIKVANEASQAIREAFDRASDGPPIPVTLKRGERDG